MNNMDNVINSVKPGFSSGANTPHALKTTEEFAYRVCGMDQIQDIIECGFVRPKGYGTRRERVGDKLYWSIGGHNLHYIDKRPVLQAPLQNVQDGQIGPIPLESLCGVWLFDENTNSYVNQIDYINELHFNNKNNRAR